MSDLRSAVEALPSCECDWMTDGPVWDCVCGEHNARPYRDDVVHLPDGQHARRACAVLAIIDAHQCLPSRGRRSPPPPSASGEADR